MFLAFIISLTLSRNVYSWSIQSSYRAQKHSISMIREGRKPLMAGNWKLNPSTVAKSVGLVSDLAELTKNIDGIEIAVFPPTCFLVPVYDKIKSTNIKMGGQDVHFETDGAYTGAVSTCMLKDVGVQYVLCGHSERRVLFKDDDFGINRKVLKVLSDGLIPVLCVGETKEEYEAGLNQEVCAVQLLKDLDGVSAEDMVKVVIAYEPVWAIGTGLVCPASEAQNVHKFIRSVLAKKYGDSVASKVIIQYGGSVKPDNVKEIMQQPDIDGCLVGGASLTAESFFKICNFQA